MPRFVIDEHTRSQGSHYDLMLETQLLLWTWRFDDFPGSEGEQECVRIQDHEQKFLEYEGKLSPGMGEVKIVEAGTFDLLSAREDQIHFRARGAKVVGTCLLGHRGENKWVMKCE